MPRMEMIELVRYSKSRIDEKGEYHSLTRNAYDPISDSELHLSMNEDIPNDRVEKTLGDMFLEIQNYLGVKEQEITREVLRSKEYSPWSFAVMKDITTVNEQGEKHSYILQIWLEKEVMRKKEMDYPDFPLYASVYNDKEMNYLSEYPYEIAEKNNIVMFRLNRSSTLPDGSRFEDSGINWPFNDGWGENNLFNSNDSPEEKIGTLLSFVLNQLVFTPETLLGTKYIEPSTKGEIVHSRLNSGGPIDYNIPFTIKYVRHSGEEITIEYNLEAIFQDRAYKEEDAVLQEGVEITSNESLQFRFDLAVMDLKSKIQSLEEVVS